MVEIVRVSTGEDRKASMLLEDGMVCSSNSNRSHNKVATAMATASNDDQWKSQMANGDWQMANGDWQMGNGGPGGC